MQQKMKNKNFLPIICRKFSKKMPIFGRFYPFFAKQNKNTKNKESPILLGFLMVEIWGIEPQTYALRRIQIFINLFFVFNVLENIKSHFADCLPIGLKTKFFIEKNNKI